MPFIAPSAPKCNRCGKSAYPAESVKVNIDGVSLTYHTACFKCPECSLKLTLKTYKVSDFGDEEVFCNKCVPKQAPSQNSESIETDRTRKAAALFRDVGIVNEQLRGSEETKGVGQSGSGSAEAERLKQAGVLNSDVGMKNEQVSRLYEKSPGKRSTPGTPEVVRATPGKFKAEGQPEAISLYHRLGKRSGGEVRTETYPVGSSASNVKTLESDLEAVRTKCSSLAAQLEAANAKIAVLEADNASMQASDFAAKKARKQSIKRSKEAGEEDAAAAEAKADEMADAAAEAAAEAAAAAAAKKSALEAELASTTAKVGELTAQMQAVMAKHDEECARADASERDAKGFAARVEELTSSAEASINAEVQNSEALMSENSELKATNSDLEHQLRTSKEALAALADGGGCGCTIS